MLCAGGSLCENPEQLQEPSWRWNLLKWQETPIAALHINPCLAASIVSRRGLNSTCPGGDGKAEFVGYAMPLVGKFEVALHGPLLLAVAGDVSHALLMPQLGPLGLRPEVDIRILQGLHSRGGEDGATPVDRVGIGVGAAAEDGCTCNMGDGWRLVPHLCLGVGLEACSGLG